MRDQRGHAVPLVQAGLGVSLVPRIVIDQLFAEVRPRPVAELGLTRTVSGAVRAGSGADPRPWTPPVLALRRNVQGDWARTGGAGRDSTAGARTDAGPGTDLA